MTGGLGTYWGGGGGGAGGRSLPSSFRPRGEAPEEGLECWPIGRQWSLQDMLDLAWKESNDEHRKLLY